MKTFTAVLLFLLASITAFGQSLKVSSFPAGANVTIDGVDTGKVTPMSTSITLGSHVVVISVPNSQWTPSANNVVVVSGVNYFSACRIAF